MGGPADKLWSRQKARQEGPGSGDARSRSLKSGESNGQEGLQARAWGHSGLHCPPAMVFLWPQIRGSPDVKRKACHPLLPGSSCPEAALCIHPGHPFPTPTGARHLACLDHSLVHIATLRITPEAPSTPAMLIVSAGPCPFSCMGHCASPSPAASPVTPMPGLHGSCLYPPGLSTTCVRVTGGQESLGSITGRQLMPIPDGMTTSPLWKSKVFSPFLPQLFIMQMSKRAKKLKGRCSEHTHALYLGAITGDVLPFFCAHTHKFPLSFFIYTHSIYISSLRFLLHHLKLSCRHGDTSLPDTLACT